MLSFNIFKKFRGDNTIVCLSSCKKYLDRVS